MKKRIAVIGSTGSIGRQALSVIAAHPDRFKAEVLTACTNADLLIAQARKYAPSAVVIADSRHYQKVQKALAPAGIKVYAGEQEIAHVVQLDTVDVVLMAVVGYAGLPSTLQALRARKQIALANKEVLVVAGELVTQMMHEHKATLYPIDSEHSAIFQCLVGENRQAIEKIILTASGGPFRGRKATELEAVTALEALKHPNWVMGDKVTIDSATLMNKGLEVIEAKWLFDLAVDQIEVVVHPQSVIHSMVQFRDGSVKAQLGVSDMRLPIQFALAYPDRLINNLERVDFDTSLSFTFEKPDTKTFRNLALAFEALEKGGSCPCVLNAANEVAVASFLKGKIGFLDMPRVVEQCMDKLCFIASPNYEDYVAIDGETRVRALEEIDYLVQKKIY